MARALLISILTMLLAPAGSAVATSASLTLPAQLMEGVLPANNATLTVDQAPASPLVFSLSASPSNEVYLPPTITVPAGQTQVVFTIQALDDIRIDGNVSVTVTASASGVAPVSAQTTTIDNETRGLWLQVPGTILEGGTASGTVSVPGILVAPLTVNLTSSNETALTVPAKVTIPANASSTTFTITALDNADRDGSRTVRVDATADTFNATHTSIVVRDNEVAAYSFGTLADIVDLNGVFSVTAADIEGNAIGGFVGDVDLSVVFPDGSTQPTTPATISLSGPTGWTGTLSFPQIVALPIRLRAIGHNGYSGDSTAFDVMHVLPLIVADLAWDSSRNRIYASIPASASNSYANQVIAIDPVTLQIAASVMTSQNPGALALTTGGEALYVALEGNGTLARIDPDSMTIISSFAVGTDPSGVVLRAEDICPVAGEPNVIVVSRYREDRTPRYSGVVAYDNGVMRPHVLQSFTGPGRIESSSDPTLFFGYDVESSDADVHRIRLDVDGVFDEQTRNGILGEYGADLFAAGNTLVSLSMDGWGSWAAAYAADGATMQPLGTFAANSPGTAYGDVDSNRIYFVEPPAQLWTTYDRISAFDPRTLALIRRLTFSRSFSFPEPRNVTPTHSFPVHMLRWGSNGVVFRTNDSVALINSDRLIPTAPSANLRVTLDVAPAPAYVGDPLNYVAHVTNDGPNIARNVIASVRLSDFQTIASVAGNTGTPTVSGRIVSLSVGDLEVGAAMTLSITTVPQSAGALSCTASVNSASSDPDCTNNSAARSLVAGFHSTPDTFYQVRIKGGNLTYDPTRNLLWATVPYSADPPYDQSLVSIDPLSGFISEPFFTGVRVAGCMKISGNGRYLYIGHNEEPGEVLRIDLNSTPYTIAHIPLRKADSGDVNHTTELEVLEGDGKSFLYAGSRDCRAVAMDDTVPRPIRTDLYSVANIKTTGNPNIFLARSYGSSISRIAVDASGVHVVQAVPPSAQLDILAGSASGDHLLGSDGRLYDTSTFALLFQFSGFWAFNEPCLDWPSRRGYLFQENRLVGFDVSNGSSLGSLALPAPSQPNWGGHCLHWGSDGLAMFRYDYYTEPTSGLYVGRWSAALPSGVDANSDLISDNWENAYFGTTNVSSSGDADGDGIANAFEFLFGTSPVKNNSSPLQTSTSFANGQRVFHFVFPRRVGASPQSYGFETSSDLQHWNVVAPLSETVLFTQGVGGVLVQTIDAVILSPGNDYGFARLKWLGP